jgi:hypothetical protein
VKIVVPTFGSLLSMGFIASELAPLNVERAR